MNYVLYFDTETFWAKNMKKKELGNPFLDRWDNKNWRHNKEDLKKNIRMEMYLKYKDRNKRDDRKWMDVFKI